MKTQVLLHRAVPTTIVSRRRPETYHAKVTSPVALFSRPLAPERRGL